MERELEEIWRELERLEGYIMIVADDGPTTNLPTRVEFLSPLTRSPVMFAGLLPAIGEGGS